MEYLIEEQNIIRKDWRSIKLSFALVYPNIYQIGMSSYSFHLLYSLLNSRDDVVCERFFLPEKIRYPALKDTNIRIGDIFSVENRIRLKEFDVIGFSIQFENDYKNILWILDAANIPLRSEDRFNKSKEQKEIYPLIIAGGPCAASNSMTLSEYVEIFFIGDVEPKIDEFLDLLIKKKEASVYLNKEIENFLTVSGLFIPSIKNECKRIVLDNLDLSKTPIKQIKSIFKEQKTKYQERKKKNKLAFGDTFLLEINRGCPYRCNFCISCHHNTPFRNKTFENIIQTIDQAIQVQEINKITFIGSCVTSHPNFIEICNYLLKNNMKFMIPSIRIDHINKKLIEILEKGNIKTLTIAPETGFNELRYFIGKRISNKQIIEAAKNIRDSNIKNLKLYFLIGLPGEQENEADAIIELMTTISELGFEKDSLKVNINPFIPKLNTPFQIYTDYFSETNLKDLKSKFEKIQNGISKIPSVKLKIKNIKKIINEALIQTLFSVGDNEVSGLLFDYYHFGATLGALKKAAKKNNFSFDTYFKQIRDGYKPLPPSCSILLQKSLEDI